MEINKDGGSNNQCGQTQHVHQALATGAIAVAAAHNENPVPPTHSSTVTRNLSNAPSVSVSTTAAASQVQQKQQQIANIPFQGPIATHMTPLHLQFAGHLTPLPPCVVPSLPTSTRLQTPSTPSIFHSRKLRSGKWIPEEEQYADLLIELFEKGQIEDCENGCTLRSFLSRRLHCAPMRISKKYAGKGIGKMVFLAKPNLGRLHGMPSAELRSNMTRLCEAEAKFHKAIFPDSAPPSTAKNGLVAIPHVQLLPGLAPLVPTPPLGLLQPALAGVNSVWQQQQLQPQPQPQLQPPQMQPHQNQHQKQKQQEQQQEQQETHAAGQTPVNSSEGARQLHQTYMFALNQAHTETLEMSEDSKKAVPQQPGAISSATQAVNQKGGVGTYQTSKASVSMSGPQQSCQAMKQQHGSDTRSPHPSKPDQEPLAKFQDQPLKPLLPESQLPENHTSVLQQPQFQRGVGTSIPAGSSIPATELPDFLSGFDQVARRCGSNDHTKSVRWAGESADLFGEHTKPFTTRSFDDFHQFLGKELPPQTGPLPVEGALTPAAAVIQRKGTDANGPFVSADSYVMFAQESALAASQHSAYSRQSGVAMHFHKKAGGQVVPDRPLHPILPRLDANPVPPQYKRSQQACAVSLERSKDMYGLKPSTAIPQVYTPRTSHVVSGSEPSNSDMGSDSVVGSSRGSGTDSSTGSDNDDSNSDEGGSCRKKPRIFYSEDLEGNEEEITEI